MADMIVAGWRNQALVQYISSKMSFIYIPVCIDLNMASGPMHTENLTPPADALHYHRV